MFLFSKAAHPFGACDCLVDESTVKEHQQYLNCHLSMKMGQIEMASHSSLRKRLVTEQHLNVATVFLDLQHSKQSYKWVLEECFRLLCTARNLVCNSKSLDQWSKKPLSVNQETECNLYCVFSNSSSQQLKGNKPIVWLLEGGWALSNSASWVCRMPEERVLS